MRPYALLAVVAFAVFLLWPRASHAFVVPESLQYDLKWMGINAGSATLEFKSRDEAGYIIQYKVLSAKWLDSFYPVRDVLTSVLEKNRMPSRYEIDVSEGRRKRHKAITFKRAEGKALFRDYIKKEEKSFDVPEDVYDPMSGFYAVRDMELQVGRSVFVKIFDSKKVWDVEVKVLKKETLELPAGRFDTVLIKPLLKSEGVFFRKGGIWIWLTDDENRIPVKIRTKVKLGSVRALLVGGTY